MKKLIIGFILGAVFMFSSQAIADTVSLVGKKVGSEAKVVLDGKELSNAVIINSKSFAPVRDIAEAFGAEVEWKNGVVKITSFPKEHTISLLKLDIRQKREELDILEQSNKGLEENWIPLVESNLEKGPVDAPAHEIGLKQLQEFKDKLKENKERIQVLNEEIAVIEKQIAKLESTK